MATTTSSAPPGPTTTDASSGNSGPSSPLLFFVALGFGVVFTNLWIIVGVKYCFRYNQRNRARLAGEDPDGVDLNTIPRQRRRREKKLMTMEEVNERFPLIKYKTWRSSRADQGLPTAGGITNAASRPASIRNKAHDTQGDVEIEEVEPKTPTTSTMNEKDAVVEHGRPEQIGDIAPATSSAEPSTPATTTLAAPEPMLVKASTNDETEEVDRIQTAIPAEQLPDPGDTCAICIDVIEDDDDIRGLSCGHAFHASCVDPWLTSRRACCPLCKADYYVPKPRPEGAQDDAIRSSRQEQLMHQSPFAIFPPSRPGYRRGRQRPFNLQGVFLGSSHSNLGRSRPNQSQSIATNATAEATEEHNPESWRQRLPNLRMPTVPALSRIRRGRGNEAGERPVEASSPTPAQLEAGRE